MRVLAFDGRMGASGDMLLGALIAAGADRGRLEPIEDALDSHFAVDTTTKCGIEAIDVTVHTGSDDTAAESSHSHDRHGESSASHEHEDSGHHAGESTHSHDHEGNGPPPHRSYEEVIDIVESLPVSEPVRQDALAVFEGLGEAEAAIHGLELLETHFHEVGADDAIADVVGVAVLVDDLEPDRIVTTPLSTGGGSVSMAHGEYPVPAPAVVELAEDAAWSVRGGPVEAELLTPTGAALLAHFADGVASLPPMTVEAGGYGAGSASFDEHPNVLRAVVGTVSERLQQESITVLETNIDDATPEVIASLQDSLPEAGARDVSILPMTMKKSRPGFLVKVVVKPEDSAAVARRLARETGTLGVREVGGGHRFIADREQSTVTLSLDGNQYDVAVKRGLMDGEVFDVSAEFDDANRVARETGRPVREVIRLAEQCAREETGDAGTE